MNKIIALATLAIAALVAASVAFDNERILAAAPRSVTPGDILVYDVTVDVQMYALGPNSRPSMTRVSSGAGTETIAIYRVESDGTADAGLTISYRGTADSRPVNVERSWRAQLAPDGEIRSVGARPPLGDDLDQALTYINGLAKGLRMRTLATGATWRVKEPLGSSSGSMIMTDTVAGVQTYHGFQTYVIAQNGAGAFTQSVDGSPGVGSIAIGGTLYYDKADKVLIGGAFRSQTEMALSRADIAHISATTTIKVQLHSWTRAPAAAQASRPAAGSASATPSGAASAPAAGGPVATPASTPAYTPAPIASATPSPISTGN